MHGKKEAAGGPRNKAIDAASPAPLISLKSL
jgi:hypothetical protein